MKRARAASRSRNQPWNRSGQAAVAVSSGSPTWNQGGNPAMAVGGGNPAWTPGGQVVATGGAWRGSENQAANANTPAGSIGPPPPPHNWAEEERVGALAARVFGGYEDGEDSWAWH
ncbi:uncharacterized protein LOC125199716 [Salvia hispanica]|uniref:uncharacterized protein LOC125199716 n=1 Tax=Salvia hispanica TaxID=49212 RepID=UPI002009A6B7|nr:uncharacterized protein LOC125199716 [Salvia hispanica]